MKYLLPTKSSEVYFDFRNHKKDKIEKISHSI